MIDSWLVRDPELQVELISQSPRTTHTTHTLSSSSFFAQRHPMMTRGRVSAGSLRVAESDACFCFFALVSSSFVCRREETTTTVTYRRFCCTENPSKTSTLDPISSLRTQGLSYISNLRTNDSQSRLRLLHWSFQLI